MCGLYGWVLFGKISGIAKERMADGLATMNLLRGMDSWGFYDVGRNLLLKDAGTIPDGPMRVQRRADALIGHTRHATTGSVTAANAHPFRIGPVVGAHNGIIYNHQELNSKHGRKFPVDSMHLFGHLASGLTLSDISGYGAASWYDARTKQVSLARFDGDLAVAGLGTEKECFGVVWSSDDKHLRAVLSMSGVKFFLYSVENRKRYYVGKTGLFVESGEFKVGKRGGTAEWWESSAWDPGKRNLIKSPSTDIDLPRGDDTVCDGCGDVTILRPYSRGGRRVHLCSDCAMFGEGGIS